MKVKTVIRNGKKVTLFERGDGRQDVSFSEDLIGQLIGKDLSSSLIIKPPPVFLSYDNMQAHLFKTECVRSNLLASDLVRKESCYSKALLLPNAHKQFWLAYESKREKGLRVEYTFVEDEIDILNTCIISLQSLRTECHKFVILGLMTYHNSFHAMDSLLLPLTIHELM
jgi:hypothetical protein